jgi:hypothetical protein
VTPTFVGSFLMLDDLSPGDVVTLTFPVLEDTATYTWNKRIPGQEQEFTFRMRGSTCVSVANRPDMGLGWLNSYEREHMKAAKAPMVDKTFFVPDRTFRFW